MTEAIDTIQYGNNYIPVDEKGKPMVEKESTGNYDKDGFIQKETQIENIVEEKV